MRNKIFRFLGINPRIAIVLIHDVAMAAISFEAALQIRYILYGAPQPLGFLWQGTILFALVCGFIFWRMGLYRGIWYYASLNDLAAIFRAVTFSVIIFLPLLFVFNRLDAYPRVALPINWFLLVTLLTLPRFFYRAIKDRNLTVVFKREDPDSIPVLLVGAGDSGETFLREMERMRLSPYNVVGIVDNRSGRIGRDIRGVRVLGSITDIPLVMEGLKSRGIRPQRLILAGDFDGPLVRELVDMADSQGLTLGRIPTLTDFHSGEEIEVRRVDVGDLLGRPQKVLDRHAMGNLVEGRNILITGAGGTIGSELSLQIASYSPSSIILFDNGEYNLFSVNLDLGNKFPSIPTKAILGDVRDLERVQDTFSKHSPDLVFHTAAFKHVPLAESNPDEAILTNVIGTKNIVDACRTAEVSTMVLISTDKAVHSSSVMGASKRVAELICQAANKNNNKTNFITVRFGNVLGSTGSVIPLFERQLALGGPLTVTHPDVTRYFMTVREAVELVLQASALPVEEIGKDSVFVLDMGEPVRIQDLARQMLRLYGKKGETDIQIEFIGLRPGEKLHESLFHEDENLRQSSCDGIQICNARNINHEILEDQLNKLERSCRSCDTVGTINILTQLVPEANILEMSKEDIGTP